jgi:hypothetical protein
MKISIEPRRASRAVNEVIKGRRMDKQSPYESAVFDTRNSSKRFDGAHPRTSKATEKSSTRQNSFTVRRNILYNEIKTMIEICDLASVTNFRGETYLSDF